MKNNQDLVAEVDDSGAKIKATKDLTDDISSRIRLLDRGKENLTNTVAAMQKLLMLGMM